MRLASTVRFAVDPKAFRRAALAAAVVAASAGLPGMITPAAADDSVVEAGGMVRLPYTVSEANGNQWMVYYEGALRQQGNQPIYSQGAMLNINGQQPRVNGQQGKFDEKAKELVLEMRPVNGLNLTRRMFFDTDAGVVRITDVFRNTTNREMTTNVNLTTNINYGVNDATIVQDPKNKDQNIGWIADTGAGRAAMDLFSGKGTKLAPQVTWQQGNNVVQAQYPVTIPANGAAALVHWHGTFDSSAEAQKWVEGLKESKVLSSLPADIRRVVVNLGGGSGFVGDRELLRGEATDVIELRGGDQIRGDLLKKDYVLQTFYGEVSLPADRVVGLFNIGQFRPRQLVVTKDGEIFGGTLKEPNIGIKLSSGQSTEIPLSQITRMGYRHREGEPDEWTFNQPLALLRSGERVLIKKPEKSINFLTRYGQLELKAGVIAAMLFTPEEHGVHDVYLTDGSKFSGLVVEPDLTLGLVSATDGKPITIPTATLRRVQLVASTEDDHAGSPTLSMSNGDILAARLSGELKLDTSFDTLTIDASQVQAIARVPDSGMDVQVTLWDESTVRGQLETPALQVKLVSGLSLKIPVAALEEYANPSPFPAPGMAQRAKEAVKNLNDDDWKKRDAAEAALVAMGPVIIGVIGEERDAQTPEAQQRIDAIIAKLKKDQPQLPSKLPPIPSME